MTNSSDVIKEFFMETVVKFYVDIEFSGTNEAFFTKFHYRHDCAQIFKLFWPLKFF
jgi:hypothetical protein